MKDRVRATDFENRERPKTRRGQFFDLFRHRFLEIMKISWLQAIFQMPLYVSVVLFWILFRKAENYDSAFTIILILSASFLVSIPTLYIGLSGVYGCLRRLVHAEGEYASSDFFLSLKEDWRNGMATGFIVAFSLGGGLIGGFYLYGDSAVLNGWLSAVGIALLAIQFLVVTVVSYHQLGQGAFYQNGFGASLGNGLRMSLSRFPLALLFFLIHPGILIACFSLMSITAYTGVGLSLFFSGFAHLIWMLYLVSTFDRYINKDNFPDYYRRGLYQEKEEA